MSMSYGAGKQAEILQTIILLLIQLIYEIEMNQACFI